MFVSETWEGYGWKWSKGTKCKDISIYKKEFTCLRRFLHILFQNMQKTQDERKKKTKMNKVSQKNAEKNSEQKIYYEKLMRKSVAKIETLNYFCQF